jgi:hypothetical protein
MHTIKKERKITPVVFAHHISCTLYEHWFGPCFIKPVVACLEPIPMPVAAEAPSAAEGGKEATKRRYCSFPTYCAPVWNRDMSVHP